MPSAGRMRTGTGGDHPVLRETEAQRGEDEDGDRRGPPRAQRLRPSTGRMRTGTGGDHPVLRD